MNESVPAGRPRLPSFLKSRRAAWAAVLVLLLGALLGASLVRSGEKLHHLSAKVTEGEIRDVVDATGTVSAVITVQVGSQVSGTIAKLNADFNSRVRKGDVVAVIAPQLFEGSLLQATADQENARANVTAAEANVTKAQATLAQTRAEYDRVTALARERVESQQAVDLAKANFETAQASVEAAKANILQARAQLHQKEAAVAVARTNLDYTVIRSPIDGIVVARNVDVGQTVAASLQAPTIFTIAQDLTKMLVYAKVDESDVGRISLGQPVTFKVDAFPKETFRGTLKEIRMNPSRIQNVVTYDTIVEFDNPDLKLFPGMTAYVTIPVATVANAVKLPNAALRYKPPYSVEALKALYARHGLDDGSRPPAGGAAASAPAAGRRPARLEDAVVWKLLADGSVEPVKVALGITDHTYTEVTRVVTGTLRPGDEVVTTSSTSRAVLPASQGARR